MVALWKTNRNKASTNDRIVEHEPKRSKIEEVWQIVDNKQEIVDNTSKNHRLKKCGDESGTKNKKQAATMGKVSAGNDGKESKYLKFKIGRGVGKGRAATHHRVLEQVKIKAGLKYSQEMRKLVWRTTRKLHSQQ